MAVLAAQAAHHGHVPVELPVASSRSVVSAGLLVVASITVLSSVTEFLRRPLSAQIVQLPYGMPGS